MLDTVGVGSLDELAQRTVPASIAEDGLTLELPAPATEAASTRCACWCAC